MTFLEKTSKPIDRDQYLRMYDTVVNYCFKRADIALLDQEVRKSKIWAHAAKSIINTGNFDYFYALKDLKYLPPDAKEFLENPDFLGKRVELWEKTKEKIIECNPDVLAGEKPVNQVIDTGAIGIGKSFDIFISGCYLTMFMCGFNDPRKLFGLDASTQLVCMFMSDGSLASNLSLYKPAREIFLGMPFVHKMKHIQYNDQKESELILNNNIYMIPQVAGSEQARKALATFFVGLDECNHQPVIVRSKRAETGEQVYDQARLNYDTFLSRAQSRFSNKSFGFYKIIVAGSARRTTSMIETLIKDVAKEPDKEKREAIKIYRNVQFEVRPKHFYCGDTFTFCLGDEKYNPHVLDSNEQIKPNMKVRKDTPIEYLSLARMSPYKCQRDVFGEPTDAIASFIGNNQAIADAFTTRVKSIVHKNNVVLGMDADPNTYLIINEENLPPLDFRKNVPHWISVDLSKSGCATAISMGYIDHFEAVGKALKPHFKVPLAASVIPDNGNEIRPERIRALIYKLVELGYWIAGISYDNYNSTESLQELEDNGFCVAEISVVRTNEPYEDAKSLIVEKRIEIAANEVAEKEFKELEEIMYGNRIVIEKPANGSKDIADTIAALTHYALKSVIYAQYRMEFERTGKVPDLEAYKKNLSEKSERPNDRRKNR